MATSGSTPVIEFENHLRPFPAAAAQLMQACKDPSCQAKDVTSIIECDPGLSARVMKLSNSSLYGCSGKIKSINHAVVLLGMSTVRDIAISMAGAALFTQESNCKELHHELWMHSLASACISRALCSHQNEVDPNEAFLAGLFHDVGKIIFLDMVPDEYAPVFLHRQSQFEDDDEVSLVNLETKLFGLSHSELGLACAKPWGLPTEITEAIGYHHTPEDSPHYGHLSKVTSKASELAWKWKIDQTFEPEAEEDLDPEQQQWNQIRQQATKDFKETLQVCNS